MIALTSECFDRIQRCANNDQTTRAHPATMMLESQARRNPRRRRALCDSGMQGSTLEQGSLSYVNQADTVPNDLQHLHLVHLCHASIPPVPQSAVQDLCTGLIAHPSSRASPIRLHRSEPTTSLLIADVTARPSLVRVRSAVCRRGA